MKHFNTLLSLKNISQRVYLSKIIILIILFIFPLFGQAQNQRKSNPGYMGKHFIVTGEVATAGLLIISQQFWFKYGGTAEFIIGRKLSLGVSYIQHSSNITDVQYSDACYDYTAYTLNTRQYALDLYIYPNSVAPLGKFVRLQIAYLDNYSDDFYKNGTLKKGNDPYSCRGHATDRISSPNILISAFFGKKRVFYNSLIVSYGFQLGMTFNNPLTNTITDDIDMSSSSGSEYGEDKLFLSKVAEENFMSSLISFKVNVGFIW